MGDVSMPGTWKLDIVARVPGEAQPIVLLQLGANVAGAIFVIAAPHLLYINTRLLPPHVRPPMWRRLALVAMTLFYGFFVALSLASFFA